MTGKLRIRKITEYGITLLIIASLNFLLPRMMPGDPFLFISGEEGEEITQFSEAQKEYYMEQYGFDRPLIIQYTSYMGDLLRGDLGYSIYFNQKVSAIIAKRAPWTVLLVTAAVFLSTLLGILIGGISAHYRHSWQDRLLYIGVIMISEIPAFLSGLVLLFLFAAGLGWFPLSGGVRAFADYSGKCDLFRDIAFHAALPVLTLTIVRTGSIYLLARNSMISVLAKDYIKTARAKGLKRFRVFFRHTLRNAMLPLVTRVFLSLGSLIGGAVLVENVFNYPGLGRLMKEAVLLHDYPLIQGIFFMVALCVLLAGLSADLLYEKLDPRIAGRLNSAEREIL